MWCQARYVAGIRGLNVRLAQQPLEPFLVVE